MSWKFLFGEDSNFGTSSGFGEREPPKTSGGTGNGDHKGVDIKVNEGTSIYAPADGVVVFSGTNSDKNGNRIKEIDCSHLVIEKLV